MLLLSLFGVRSIINSIDSKILFTFIFVSSTAGLSDVGFAFQSGTRSAVPSGPRSSSPVPTINFQDGYNQTLGLPPVVQHEVPSVSGDGQAQGSTNPSGGSTSFGIPASGLVDPIFEIHDPNSNIVVDHSIWDHFLAHYLVTDPQGLNRIHYRYVCCHDYANLQRYLKQLQETDIRILNRNEQLAFWFNLYNARTVFFVLQNYRIRTILQVKENFLDFVGPFDDAGAVHVLGKALSLNDIESGIIRPIWKDPRIHYAVNCASFGCPNLASTAWTAQNLDGRLNHSAYEYINSDRAIKTSWFGLRLTKIYSWYRDDFGGSDQAVLNHIRQYANANTLRRLAGYQEISGYFYDWSLNDARIQRKRLLEPFLL